jgi:predicted TPR repeat methyltransferase
MGNTISPRDLSESLLRDKKTKEATAFMELNEEVNTPLSKWGYSCLALAHQANSENQKAERDFSRILELDPKDSWAAAQLKSIQSAPKAE